ncbi:MAG: lysylphosphatidylglycerol synthase transmembrane domain-containing protein [Anaerolineae bacterium]
MTRRRMNILRILISAGALLFLFWRVVSPDETFDVLRRADLRPLLGGLLLFVASLVIRAYRWIVLLRGLDSDVPFSRLVHLYFAGQFFSSFLPTQFGGDVMRALELTEDTDSPAAVGTVLLDRMIGLLILFVIGLVALPFVVTRIAPWLLWLLLIVSGTGLAAGVLVLEGRLLRRASAWLPQAVSLSGGGPLAQVYAAVTGCGWQAVGGASAISLGFNIVNIFINWLAAQAVGIRIGMGYFFVVTPILSISGLIPSIGGWGVREAVSTALFAPVGVDENAAVALGITLNGISLAAGLVGGLVYGIGRLRSRQKGQEKPNREQDDHQLKQR